MWEMFHLGSAEPYGDKKDMIDVKRLVNLINIVTGSPSWNSHHHDQTIHTNENLIKIEFVQNYLCCNIVMITFDFYGYGCC